MKKKSIQNVMKNKLTALCFLGSLLLAGCSNQNMDQSKNAAKESLIASSAETETDSTQTENKNEEAENKEADNKEAENEKTDASNDSDDDLATGREAVSLLSEDEIATLSFEEKVTAYKEGKIACTVADTYEMNNISFYEKDQIEGTYYELCDHLRDFGRESWEIPDFDPEVEIAGEGFYSCKEERFYVCYIYYAPNPGGNVTLVMKEKECGLEILTSITSMDRDRFHLYDGMILSENGSGGAACAYETYFYFDKSGQFEKIGRYHRDMDSWFKDVELQGMDLVLNAALEEAGLFEVSSLIYEELEVDGKHYISFDFLEEDQKVEGFEEKKEAFLQKIELSDAFDGYIITDSAKEYPVYLKDYAKEFGIDLTKTLSELPLDGTDWENSFME